MTRHAQTGIYAGLAAIGAGLFVLVALGVDYRQRWSWLVIPTWIIAISTLGLFAGAVLTAIYAQRTFANQTAELRDQRAFNSRQVEFNDKQLEILENQRKLAQEAERRQRTPRFSAEVLTRNDGSLRMYLHLRLLSEYPLERIDVKLLDRIDGFPVDCPIGFAPGQWGVARYAADGSSPWHGPKRYQDTCLRDRAWWPADPAVDSAVGPDSCTRLDVGGGAVWQFERFPDLDWPSFAHLRVLCRDEAGETWTVTVDIDLPTDATKAEAW
jgi:hypothetical protein